MVAVAVAGIPLCVVVSPLIFGAILIAAHLWDFVVPLSPERWESLRRVALVFPEVWAVIRGRSADVPWGSLAMLLLAPGALTMLVAWPFVRHLSRLAGAGTILRRIPSREPDLSVVAEHQLANVVQEMAVAAGVPVPPVRIIESPAVNVVAIGLTTNDATILASTGFLQKLNRDERQAMIAHLVGSVGNGDLEIAAVILSVIETWALLTALFEAILHRPQRALVRSFAHAARRSLRGTVSREEASAVIDGLLGDATPEPPDPMNVALDYQPTSCLGVLHLALIVAPMLATVGLASIAARSLSSLFTVIGFGPWLAAMWRARRRLADATAVQLTRNPSALAGAVRKFGESDVVIPEGWPVNFLFPAWTAITDANAASAMGAAMIVGMRLEPEPRLEELAVLGAQLEEGLPRLTFAQRMRRGLGTPQEFAMAIGWGALALVLCLILLVVSLAATAGMLAVLWVVLDWLRPGPSPS